MSKEEIIKNIDAINAELKKNEDLFAAYAEKGLLGNSDLLTLKMLSYNLTIARNAWIEMLFRDYGILYIG